MKGIGQSPGRNLQQKAFDWLKRNQQEIMK